MKSQVISMGNQSLVQEQKGNSEGLLQSKKDQKEFSEEYKDIDANQYKKYKMVTRDDKIPFAGEMAGFTDKQITEQRRQLIKTALQYGLKLKAKDEDLADQRQRKIKEMHSGHRGSGPKILKSNSQNLGQLKHQGTVRAPVMSHSKSQSSLGYKTNENNLRQQ